MKKTAKEIIIGNILEIGGEILTVTGIESSEIGKQGTAKVRIVAKKKTGEDIVIIRPADYPFTTQ